MIMNLRNWINIGCCDLELFKYRRRIYNIHRYSNHTNDLEGIVEFDGTYPYSIKEITEDIYTMEAYASLDRNNNSLFNMTRNTYYPLSYTYNKKGKYLHAKFKFKKRRKNI